MVLVLVLLFLLLSFVVFVVVDVVVAVDVVAVVVAVGLRRNPMSHCLGLPSGPFVSLLVFCYCCC